MWWEDANLNSRITPIWCNVRCCVWNYTTGDPHAPIRTGQRSESPESIARLERRRARTVHGVGMMFSAGVSSLITLIWHYVRRCVWNYTSGGPMPPLRSGQRGKRPLPTTVPMEKLSTYSTWSRYEVFGGGKFAHHAAVAVCTAACSGITTPLTLGNYWHILGA